MQKFISLVLHFIYKTKWQWCLLFSVVTCRQQDDKPEKTDLLSGTSQHFVIADAVVIVISTTTFISHLCFFLFSVPDLKSKSPSSSAHQGVTWTGHRHIPLSTVISKIFRDSYCVLSQIYALPSTSHSNKKKSVTYTHVVIYTVCLSMFPSQFLSSEVFVSPMHLLIESLFSFTVLWTL